MTKLTTNILTTTLLLGMGTVYASNLDLEPCMNGDVPLDGVLTTLNANRDRFTSTR